MMFGGCPYEDCEHTACRYLPDLPLPQFSQETCDGCGRTVWVLYSRVDPMVYTKEGFEAEFEHDPVKKTIRKREECTPENS